jgi:hypothetical protein
MRIIYLDENFPHQIAEAFDIFERNENILTVKSTVAAFGVGATDDAIIKGMAKSVIA